MDDGIQEDEKAEIAKKLHEVLSEDSEEQDYSYARSKKLTFEILEKEKRPFLSTFVGTATKTVFEILKMNKEQREFLMVPPSTWQLLTVYKRL